MFICISQGSRGKEAIELIHIKGSYPVLPGIQQWLPAHWRGWEPSRCPVLRAGCLSSSNLMLKARRILGGPLVFSRYGKLKRLSPSVPVVATVTELTHKTQKQAGKKQNLSPRTTLYEHLGCHQKVWITSQESLPISTSVTKKTQIPERPNT